MKNDDHLIFEAYSNKNITESNKLEFTYEVATARLPRDIDISTREGQEKVLSLAYDELVKAYTGKYKNPRLAARNTFDEDFPMEVISQYKYYQEHGFPDLSSEESPKQYADDMEKDYTSQKIGSENEEQKISKYKNIIDQLSKGAFDTESEKELVDQGAKEGIFDVDVVEGKRQVVLTNNAVKKIETLYPKLKGKFWECGKCKADYPGCGAAKREQSEDAEMSVNDFNKLKQHINKGPLHVKSSKELPYTHNYIHNLAKQDPREGQKEENAEDQNTRNWINIFHRTFGPGYREEMEKSGQDPYKFFVDYYIAYLKNPEIVNKFAGLYNVKYPSHQVDLKRLHKEIDEIKDKPIEGYKAPSKNRSEQEERRLDAKCWKGYHKQGTKLKGGVRVNNCVKNK